jgi:hypothetical protein
MLSKSFSFLAILVRSPTEDENGGFPSEHSPRLVIPAHAGIQVCSSPELAWIPALWQCSEHAFAGMTEHCSYLRIPGSLLNHPRTRILDGAHEGLEGFDNLCFLTSCPSR